MRRCHIRVIQMTRQNTRSTPSSAITTDNDRPITSGVVTSTNTLIQMFLHNSEQIMYDFIRMCASLQTENQRIQMVLAQFRTESLNSKRRFAQVRAGNARIHRTVAPIRTEQ